MKSKLLFFVILSQVVLISFLGYQIYQKRKNVLRALSINPISKENIDFKLTGKLKYFYEPKIGSWYHRNSNSNYIINTDTLHEVRDYSIEKPNNVFRIIAFGDSFTFGEGVADNNNWVKQLEDKLNENSQGCIYEVINFGVPGYDIEYSIERYKSRGTKYSPDLLIWFLKNDDFEQIREKEFIEKTTSEEILKDILTYQKSCLVELVNLKINKLLFLTFIFTDQKYKSIMESYVNNADIFLYDDLTDIYTDKKNCLPDGHPSKYGHQVIAQDVYKYLIKNKLVPCN